MNYYYLDVQSREIGPVPIDALRVLRTAGSLTDATLVRPELGGPWAALSTVIGVTPPRASASDSPSPTFQAVSAGITDARAALSHLMVNPAAGLPAAWQSLGPKRAAAAGVTLLASAAALFLVLVYLSHGFILIRPGDFSGFLKLLFATVASLGVWTLALVGAQKVLGGAPGFEGNVLVTGSLSLLWVLGLLAYALLGWRNFEVLGVVVVAIVCVNVLQLFIGLTRVSGVRDREATFAVPLVIIVGAWGTKIIFTAIFG